MLLTSEMAGETDRVGGLESAGDAGIDPDTDNESGSSKGEAPREMIE